MLDERARRDLPLQHLDFLPQFRHLFFLGGQQLVQALEPLLRRRPREPLDDIAVRLSRKFTTTAVQKATVVAAPSGTP